MTLIVKMMTGPGADSDTRTSHKLLTGVTAVEFDRDQVGTPFMHLFFVDDGDPETFVLRGNVYVMNEAGKTVSSFGCAPPSGFPVVEAEPPAMPLAA